MGEWMYSSNHSLILVLDGGEWSASRPGRFTSQDRAPGTHWIGGWVGPRAVLDTSQITICLCETCHRLEAGLTIERWRPEFNPARVLCSTQAQRRLAHCRICSTVEIFTCYYLPTFHRAMQGA
jgi:hypothetical protein